MGLVYNPPMLRSASRGFLLFTKTFLKYIKNNGGGALAVMVVPEYYKYVIFIGENVLITLTTPFFLTFSAVLLYSTHSSRFGAI